MDKAREKILDRASKLKELADRGVGGEMDNAKRFLVEYKLKYNISDSELNSHRIKDTRQFNGFSAEQILDQIFKELISQGLSILANAFKNAFYNDRKMKDAKARFSQTQIGQIKWKHDTKNFTYKGYVEDTIHYDIQETKKGATLYKSGGIQITKNFASVELAKSFCEECFINLKN